MLVISEQRRHWETGRQDPQTITRFCAGTYGADLPNRRAPPFLHLPTTSGICARMPLLRLVGACCVCLLFSGCLFGPGSGPKVLGYHQGKVHLTGNRHYTIGRVPPGWRERRVARHAVSFSHAALEARITTSAWCGQSFEDVPLRVLMGHLFSGTRPERLLEETRFMLDGREALRQRSIRRVDGVLLHFDAVVLKKDGCSFDFFAVTPPARADAVQAVFDAMVDGFHF